MRNMTQTMAHFGQTRHTLLNWVRDGCPVSCKNPGSKKIQYLFDWEKLEEWIEQRTYQLNKERFAPKPDYSLGFYISPQRERQLRKQGKPIPLGCRTRDKNLDQIREEFHSH